MELRKFLKQGTVLYVKYPERTGRKPHFWVVLNKEIKENEEVLSVIATSQVESVLKGLSFPKKQEKCLVFLAQDHEPFLTRETVFDCNELFEFEMNDLKRLEWRYEGNLKEVTLSWIKGAVSYSIIIEREKKEKIL
jgi:hypothetical protein